MTDVTIAHAGIAACRRIVNDMPDVPIRADDVDGWYTTRAYDRNQPHVKLAAGLGCVAVSARSRQDLPARNLGTTEWVDYPQQTLEAVESDAFHEELRAVVSAKLADLHAAV